ncbi:MAG: hypothetical protein V7655_12530 [Aequorivita antarctica]
MKTKLTFVIIALFYCVQITAQTKQEVFTSIQKLVAKTQGEKVQTNDVFSKKDDKLGKQVFTEKEITVNTIPGGKSDYEWISRATEISWNHFFDYFIYTEFANSDLQVVELNFKQNFKDEHFTNTKTADEYPSSSAKFKFYILTTDKEALEQLLTRLYELKEKKAESPFNKEIQKFTKEQTISWLREKLKNNSTVDSYTYNLKLVSIDDCNLVFDYSNMFGVKYSETIPTSIASVNKYNQFTYNKDICIRKTFAAGIIRPEDEFTYTDHSFLNIDSNDEDLISNIEFAMKHLASYCNKTNLNTATEPDINSAKINNTAHNYIKDFFETNFVKSIVKEKGKEKTYDYKIIDEGIIIYVHNISNPTNVYGSTNEWFYLAFDKINLNQYGSNLGYFENVNAIRFYQINGYIPHGPGNDHTKIEDATYGAGWLHIPFRYNTYSDLYAFKEILTNANVND